MPLSLARNTILTLAAIALSGSLALAQQAPAPPAPPSAPTPPAAPIERQPPSEQMGPGMGHGPMHPDMMRGQHNGAGNFDESRGPRAPRGPMDADFHIAPSGMWWKNPMVIQRLTLTPEQTKKMDDIFQLSANPLDSTKAMAQIDKVAQSRADLEKAHARMLLGIRTVLTPDQWTKLNDRRGPGGFVPQGGPGTPDAPGPPSNGGPGRTRGMRGGGAPSPNTSNRVQPIDQP